jgi:hypothetical protein
MSLIDDFKARFPEFTPATVDTAWPGLEASWPIFYNSVYGSSPGENEKILNLIAHLFAVDQKKGAAILSTSKSVGSVSTTSSVDANTSNRESFFNSTKYGQRFFLMTQHRHGACFV